MEEREGTLRMEKERERSGSVRDVTERVPLSDSKAPLSETSKDVHAERGMEKREQRRDHIFGKKECMLWRCMMCCNRFW